MSDQELKFIRYSVLKFEDLDEALTDEQVREMKNIIRTVREYRENIGKDPAPNYLVVNTDEKYSHKVADIIEKHEGEKVLYVRHKDDPPEKGIPVKMVSDEELYAND